MLTRSTIESESIMNTNTNKETIAAAPSAAVAATVITKADKARAVFADCYPDGKTTTVQRKDIINRMVAEAGLTKAGAATYLQNFKDKAGITVKKPAAVAAAPSA